MKLPPVVGMEEESSAYILLIKKAIIPEIKNEKGRKYPANLPAFPIKTKIPPPKVPERAKSKRDRGERVGLKTDFSPGINIFNEISLSID